MAIDVGTAIAYLNLDSTNFNNGLTAAESALERFQKSGGSLADGFKGVGQTMANTGYNMTKYLTVPLVNFGQTALQSYRDYESAFAGVKKTIDDTEVAAIGGYDVLSEAIQKMATETASSAEEIAAVMEMAGQLGIPLGEGGKDITEFTKAMVMLGDSTNLTANEAALNLAKFMNITGTAASESENLGSAIVDLGNNFATQEDQIVNMSTRMASAGTIAGLTSQEILALATSMSSAGIRAEAGGSAMATTLTNIEQIVQGVAENSEDKLQELARVSGMSAEDFAKTWEEEPIVALTAFLHGLGDLDEQGESAVVTLDKLGMKGVRQSNMLKALALSAENMDKALQISNSAWDDNTALVTEAEKRYSTLDSKLSQLNERWNIMKRDIAELLIPVLERLMDILENIIKWWNSLSDAQKESIVKMAEFAAVLGPVLLLLGKFLTTIGSILRVIEILSNLSKAGGLIGGLSKVGTVIATVIKTISGIALVIGGIITAVKNFIDMWTNGFNWIKEGLMVLGIALAAIGAVILGAPAAVAAVIAAIVAVIATLVVVVKEHWDDICKFFREMLDNISKWWNETWTNITNWFKDLWNGLVAWWEDFWSRLKNTLNSFVSHVKEFWSNLISMAKEKMQQIFDTVKQIVENIYNKVKEILSNIWNTIKDIVTKIWDTIKDVLTKILNSIKDLLTKIWNSIKESLTKIWNTIKDTLTNIWNSVKDILTRIWNTAVQFFQNLWNHIVSWFNNLMSSIAYWLGYLWGSIVSWFTNLISSISSWLQETWSNISTWFTNLITSIFNWLSDMWNKITDWFLNLIRSIADWLLNVWNNITDWLSNVINKLTNWFADLKNRFVNWGSNILHGLWDGLKSVWNSIASWFEDKFAWIGNLVSKIKNAVASVLGFGDRASNIRGSHANGLDYVPYDGYVAELHKGERVLTKQEARDYNGSGSNVSTGDTFNFYNTKDDPYEYARQIKRTKKELAFN